MNKQHESVSAAAKISEWMRCAMYAIGALRHALLMAWDWWDRLG